MATTSKSKKKAAPARRAAGPSRSGNGIKDAKVARKPKTAAKKRKVPASAASETRCHSRKPVFRALDSLWIPAAATSVIGLTAMLWLIHKPLDAPAPVAVSAQQQSQFDKVPERAPASQEQRPQEQRPTQSESVHPLAGLFSSMGAPTIEERVVKWSELLWRENGAKPQLEKLGPLPEIADTAPLLPRKYDCTTFVETVAALARSRDPRNFAANLLAIRYKDGKASFEDRNHFPEADWIPNNVKAGILRDVTSEIAMTGGFEAKLETKMIHRDRWLAQQLRSGKVSRSMASATEKAWKAPIEARVTYIPSDRMDRVLEKIPSGTILNFVRNNDPEHPVLITHQGFVVREKGIVMLRHASHSGNVRTVVLKDYLAKQVRERNSGKGRLIGINLNRLTET